MNALAQEIQENFIELTGETVKLLPGALLAVIILLLTRVVANLARRAARKVAVQLLKSLSLQSLLVQASYVATWVFGILFACTMAFPDWGFGDIIGLLGIGSVAIGFAFQDIFKNFLAGILLLVQEPFSLGDQIIVDDFEGTVEEIALRSTQIRTYRGELVVVPNSIVFTSPIQVMTGKLTRRTDLAIGVDYNTPLPHAVKTLYNAANAVSEVENSPSVEVDITGFGDSSIDLVVRYWTSSQQKSVRRVKTQMMQALKQACDEASISIPYPIRTVYHFDQEKYDDNAAIAPADISENNAGDHNSADTRNGSTAVAA